MAKVLVVTGDSGFLNKNPLQTKAYYQSQNVIARRQRYRMQEMEDGEFVDGKYVDGEADKYIEKNKGIDPGFVRPQEMVEQLSQKDSENTELKTQLSQKDIENAALRAQIEALKRPSVEQKSSKKE